jgi:PAT family beta-lactamase induction signal transducer AmpG
MVVPLLVRERPGERLLPWTAGQASPEAEARQLHGSWPIVARLFAALTRPSSLMFGAGVFVALVGYGLHTAFEPVAAVQKLKFSQQDFGNLAALANLAGGVFGILLSGWIATRFGNGNALIAALAGTTLVQAGIALIPGALEMPGLFIAYTISHALLFVLTSVCIYAAAMNISVPTVAATQFSVYMAVLNLGTSFGAQRFGPINSGFGYEGVLLAAASVSLAAIALFVAAGAISTRECAKEERS